MCPACRSQLAWSGADAVCGCGEAYPAQDGIPVLLTAASRADAHKAAQAAEHADDPHPARPRETPALHGMLLAERLGRSTAGIEGRIRGATALVACGGPGMDAEHLARLGARAVITTDVSPGAARMARERVERLGLPALSVVADAERLPLADRSVGVAFVLDGLHHLRDPLAGAAELARVATSAVAISEPARAGLTRVAVRAGVARDVEEAGNAVARVDPDEVLALLARAGFPDGRATRYAMHYDPAVGRLARLLSRARLRGPAGTAAGALAAAGGAWGNKVAIQATSPNGT